jgi:murein DD-endopeptidase MepM/ murein hydrolase activator NlpD
MRTARGLAVVGAGAGLVMAAMIVSVSLATAPLPLDLADAAALPAGPRRVDEGGEPPALEESSLEFPVLVLSRVRLQDSFRDPRANGERTHHAVDIMAPRHTPVRAVSDGVIARAASGGAGGLALYQLDPSGGYCFYYAHLGAYAPGVEEGLQVRRGDVIAYVGSTGNAPESAPHLHFAIFKQGARRHRCGGRPINPYPLLKLSANLDVDRPS